MSVLVKILQDQSGAAGNAGPRILCHPGALARFGLYGEDLLRGIEAVGERICIYIKDALRIVQRAVEWSCPQAFSRSSPNNSVMLTGLLCYSLPGRIYTTFTPLGVQVWYDSSERKRL